MRSTVYGSYGRCEELDELQLLRLWEVLEQHEEQEELEQLLDTQLEQLEEQLELLEEQLELELDDSLNGCSGGSKSAVYLALVEMRTSSRYPVKGAFWLESLPSIKSTEELIASVNVALSKDTPST